MGSEKDPLPTSVETPVSDDTVIDIQNLTPEEILRRRERARMLAIFLLEFLLPKN